MRNVSAGPFVFRELVSRRDPHSLPLSPRAGRGITPPPRAPLPAQRGGDSLPPPRAPLPAQRGGAGGGAAAAGQTAAPAPGRHLRRDPHSLPLSPRAGRGITPPSPRAPLPAQRGGAGGGAAAAGQTAGQAQGRHLRRDPHSLPLSPRAGRGITPPPPRTPLPAQRGGAGGGAAAAGQTAAPAQGRQSFTDI